MVRSVCNVIEVYSEVLDFEDDSLLYLLHILARQTISRIYACAEVAIGNMVRRILHMIREELERENDSKPPVPVEQQTAAAVAPPQPDTSEAAERERGPGLLTKMFRSGSMGVRTVSLHNLLDKPLSGESPETQVQNCPCGSSRPILS